MVKILISLSLILLWIFSRAVIVIIIICFVYFKVCRISRTSKTKGTCKFTKHASSSNSKVGNAFIKIALICQTRSLKEEYFCSYCSFLKRLAVAGLAIFAHLQVIVKITILIEVIKEDCSSEHLKIVRVLTECGTKAFWGLAHLHQKGKLGKWSKLGLKAA